MSTQLAPVAAVNPTAATPRPQLTAEQRVLLGLVADGHTQAAIARKVGLSSSSTENRLTRVYRALGARNAPHAVAIAYRAGLLPAPERKPGR